MRILFSDEKMFDVDGIYNAQNQRIWAPSRAEADERGGVQMRQKLGTVDHAQYIDNVLPVALEYGNKTF